MHTIAETKTALTRLIWQTPATQLTRGQRALVFAVRLLVALARDLASGAVTLRASSLVYTTLLSLVPLLAVSFSVLKGFGIHNLIEPRLHDLVEPLGPQGSEVVEALIGYVDNTNVGVLGTVGILFLLYSVVMLIAKIEQAFNATWKAPPPRLSVQHFSQYFAVLLIGPLLFVAAVSATAALRGTPFVEQLVALAPLAMLVDIGGRLVPFAFTALAFLFVYTFVPNTRVRLGSALLGALLAALLWQVVGYVFANVMAGSTRYAAIYSSLAILILFMLWLQLAWLILLLGASIAFYHQNPEYLTSRTTELRLSNRLRERLALTLAVTIAGRHYRGDPAGSVEVLAREVGMPASNVRRVLAMLEQGGFVLRTADTPPGYAPAKAPAAVRIGDLLDSIRRYGERALRTGTLAPPAVVADLEARLAQGNAETLGDLSLADLLAPTGPDQPDQIDPA